MKTYAKLLVIIFLSGMISPSFAQTPFVTGKITDALTGAPIVGATVRNRTSKKAVVSSNEGTFRIEANPTDQLEISSVGYGTTTVTAGSTELAVKLEMVSNELQQIVLVGTRTSGRVKTETAVPVDVVSVGQVMMPTARTDLTAVLNYAAPSFNYNKQSGSDGADHIDLATLRGLGPDQTLVLVNGKRRHQTAFVAVFGTRGRGNSGTDLNAIPVSSIDRVEILRDGASAQYGSDAIAGVMNIILKKTVKKFSANVGYAGYYDSKFNTSFKKELQQYETSHKFDGNAFTFGANYGLPLGKSGGFINISLDYLNSGKTFRQVLDTSNLETNKNSLPINTVRRAHGDGSLETVGSMINLETPVGKHGATFYAFGGFNHKSSDAFAFTRNFSARPDRFPTDDNGDLIEVPGIIKTSYDGERYFNPHIQTKIDDISGAVGVRGEFGGGWGWDLSNVIGRNKFHFFGDRTFNASLGPEQTHFDDGGFSFLQNTSNLNFTKSIPNVGEAFNLGFGVEYRYENYQIFAGEPASYKNFDPTGEKASGAQGFPGYQPADEVNASRSNIGAYVDAEIDVNEKWLVDGAIRIENYSDFGFTHNYKLATRYKLPNNFNLRGSISTGFRAPSLQQINYSSTFTTVQGGNIAEVKIAPNNSPITRAAGIDKLTQERSVNASLGFSWKPINNLNITVDGYWVRIQDRVVLSGQFSVDDNTLDPDLIDALKNLRVSLAQFFANAVNTTNKGVDIIADYSKSSGVNTYKVLLAANFQDMTIDDVNVPSKLNDTEDHRKTFLSDREKAFILASAPKTKFSFNFDYGHKWFGVGTRLTYFGKIHLLGYGEDGLGIDPKVPSDADASVLLPDQYDYKGKLVTDLYFSFGLNKYARLFVGADNLFNVHPSLGAVQGAKLWAFNNETGGPWDAVQMGGNGMRLYARIAFNF
jgi:iron complex outermembrane recepter protein